MLKIISDDARERFYQKLLALYGESFRDVILSQRHLEQMTRDSLCDRRAGEFLELLEERLGMSLRGKRVLEVGAGMCLGLATARKRFGADAYGIEPGEDEYSGSLEIGRELLQAAGEPVACLQAGVGEAIPFPDASFDVVFSNNVLEHTQNPEQVLAESIRVLRPGGVMYHVVPNYGSWWEGHYGVLWIPFLNKFLGRIYLRLLGKNPDYLDTLQLINRPWLRRMLAPQADGIEVLSWGQDLFVKRLLTLEFSEYAALGRLKNKLRFVHRLGLVRLLCTVGKFFHWETPFVLTVRKKCSVADSLPLHRAA